MRLPRLSPALLASAEALEVVVFPEAARGTGEGHRPWDLLPQSTMTNATVADLAAAPKSVRGAKVLVNAQERNGVPTALRVTAGRNGFAPPM